MALAARRQRQTHDIWPGFVDALATLLMVIIFLLMVFVLAQFFLSHALTGRDADLKQAQTQLIELTNLLSLERKENTQLQMNMVRLSEDLQASVRLGESLSEQLSEMESQLKSSQALAGQLESDLSAARAAAAEQAQQDAEALEAAHKTIEADRQTIELKIQEIAKLASQVERLNALKLSLEARIEELDIALASARDEAETERQKRQTEVALSESARAEAALLNQQLSALREQMFRLNKALEASETLSNEQKVQIKALGARLNAALASKVHELARYRSEFFGRLREVLGGQRDVRVEGDRFVFQSEVLFEQGKAELGPLGKEQLAKLAKSLASLSARIPSDLQWILRVDGHTDRVPIRNERFASNWELSTARAISVVRFLIDQGIPAERLAATGFADQHPLDSTNDEAALRRNRRIELKLTQR